MNKRQAKKEFKKHVFCWKPRFDKAGMPCGKKNRAEHYNILDEERSFD